MASPCTGTPRPPRRDTANACRRLVLWAGLAVGWLLPSTGCQVEYAGMTLPSGKYMHDDVQYFPPGPDFPWANTQAATQRARMQTMGIEPAPAPGFQPAPGAISPMQNRMGRPTDINASPLSIEPPVGPGGAPAPPEPGVPGPEGLPPGGVPAPGMGPAGAEAVVPPGPAPPP